MTHALDHPSARAREACRVAVEAIEVKGKLSLRALMLGMHHRRCFQRRLALISNLVGGHAVELGSVYLNSEKQPCEQKLVDLANFYGSNK